jgi:hypothetical protein
MSNEADPHTEIRSTTQPCQVHQKHMPETHINHRHHVWPKGDGGPDISDNIIVVCATGHYNIHDLLAHFKSLMGEVPYSIMRRYSMKERFYADLGYKRITRGEM